MAMVTEHIEAPPSPAIPAAPPERTTIPALVLKCFPPADQSNAKLTEFAGLLQLFLQSSTLRGRFNHFFLLMRWMGQSDSDIPLPPADDPNSRTASDPRWRRSHLLRVVLVRSPGLRAQCANVLGAMATETRCVSFFAETGLPHERGFLAEGVVRTLGYVLPSPRDDQDLEQHLRRLYKNTRKARRFSEIPLEMFHEMVEAFGMPDQRAIWEPSATALREAFVLLAARIQGLGLGRELRARGSFDKVDRSPFFILPRCSDRLLEALKNRGDASQTLRDWNDAVAACRGELSGVAGNLNQTGVSVSIVFSIETIEKCLKRMEMIAAVLSLPDGEKRSDAIHALLACCINATFEDRSLPELFASNLHLLSRKIVERTAKTGDHYIARNLKEYWWMWAAAAGGGILTVATAAFKMKILGWQLAPLPEGIFAGLNYSISFIIMLIFGLALATKQPAMTGAAMGGILRDHSRADRFDRMVDVFMLIVRTQIAAAVSNILLVGAGCTLLAYVWLGAFHEPILNAHEAEHVVGGLNPFSSGTLVFAALTGVILWASSLIGGWVENWSVCNRLSEAIADHRWGEHVGVDRVRRVARYWADNIAPWSGSIALGMMLGLTPALGRFAGFPLDVRHVTLSSGTLALALASHPEGFTGTAVLMAGAGIAVTFVLNLSVSFLLALTTAIRAYELSLHDFMKLAKTALERALTRPWQFVLPIGWPKEESGAQH